MSNPSRQLSQQERARLTRFLRERREGKQGVVVFDELPAGGTDTVPVVAGELLVRTTDLSEAARAMVRLNAPRSEHVRELGGALTRIKLPASQRGTLPQLIADLTGLGVPVYPNAVTPMGAPTQSIVWKAQSTPTRAQPPARRWNPGPGDPVRVAVIDTGITDEHRSDPWLTGLVRPDNVDPLDVFPSTDGYLDLGAGHGTFVSGIIRQVAQGSGLDVYRALDSDGLTSEVEVATALVRAVQGGAQVVNLSLGIETFDDKPPLAFTVALEQIRAMGTEVVIVAAAGNSGSRRPVWPAACGGRVVAVAALTRSYEPTAWSSYGEWVTCSTVGQQVLSTYVKGKEDPAIDTTNAEEFPADSWATWDGTSFAAPQVAGLIADTAQRDGTGVQAARQQVLQDARGSRPGYGKVLTSPLLP